MAVADKLEPTWPDRYAMLKALIQRDAMVTEVGVQFGRLSQFILDNCKPKFLLLVDAWKALPGQENDPAMVDNLTHEKRYQEVVKRFAGDNRVVINRNLSVDAAWNVANESQDLVYLDGDHSRHGIGTDIEAWWPKVRPGGILAGHDYTDFPLFIQVKPVVDDFVNRESLILQVTGEADFPSWAVMKGPRRQ